VLVQKGEGNFVLGLKRGGICGMGKRADIQTNRGPRTSHTPRLSATSTDHLQDQDPVSDFEAGANKEMAYLTSHGKPLHPINRLCRESYNFQKQLPSAHLNNLRRYLEVAPYLVPNNVTLSCETIRHPELGPMNIFVSPNLDITGILSWSQCAILLLFLQCNIPRTLHNYGDDVSESIANPKLPAAFDTLSEGEQAYQKHLLQRR
jgi:hypothetical protein